MVRLAFILSLFITASASATISEMTHDYDTIPEYELSCIFEDSICDQANEFVLELVELEEDVTIPFDTKLFLPEGFNPLKGKHDLDWNTIELVTIDEEVDIVIDSKEYLPRNFNPLNGLHDIDWNTIRLIEIEEEVELNFNTKDYLPKNFCAYYGMAYNY